ncbi:MAG: hypothetical protein ACXWK0_08555, partial [Caulobacteraceae bacterium]
MTAKIFDPRRRDFARTAIFGAAAAVAGLPAAARAAVAGPDDNVVFTKDDPGHWAGKEATHLPVATVEGGVLTVKTPHPMSEAHFIV